MEHSEQYVHLKIEDIVGKLNKLDCTLLGNKDDAWIMELLFQPGFHRCSLIEWILSKFGYDAEPKNSAENRIKNLKATLSEWGICRENNDVIEGTATIKEQLQFWSTLVDMIWTKYEIMSSISMTDSDEGIFLSPENFVSKKRIFYEFEDACSSVDKLFESGNLKHLFKCDLQLLAPDVESEIKNVSPSKLEKLETSHSQFHQSVKEDKQVVVSKIYKKLCDQEILIDDNEDDANSELELNKFEEELHKVSTDLQNIAQGAFNDVYEDLKPLILNAKAEDFVDVGPAFQKVEPVLKDFLELNKSFPELESTNLLLSKVNSELKDLLNQDTLTDVNYTSIFQLLKDKN